ncbi:hypothetical protein, partial [Microcoleus sp.]|uniref:hypothetical protein n=1 Tax=Microcoleus sp. TaxID=44472 RepID=UPI00403EA339
MWLFDSPGRTGGEKPGLMDDRTLLQPADSIKNQVSVGVRNSFVCYNSHLAPFSRTGKMPVPQRVNFFVEQAS